MGKVTQYNPEWFAIGQQVKKCREFRGLSHEELSAKIEQLPENNGKVRSPKQLSYIENGVRPLSNEYAFLIAKVLNVRVEYLFLKDDFKTEGERASAIIDNQFSRPEMIEQLIELHGYTVSVEKIFTVREMETEAEPIEENKRARKDWCKDWRTSSCHLQYPPDISDEEMLHRFHAKAPETIISIRPPSGKIVCRYVEKQEYDRIIQDIDDYIEMRLSFLFRDTSQERIPIRKGADYSNG